MYRYVALYHSYASDSVNETVLIVEMTRGLQELVVLKGGCGSSLDCHGLEVCL